MSDNVRWEPIEQGRHYMANGERVDVGEDFVSVDDCQGGETSMWLPPDIRLCRAVAAPTWSQEPPTLAPGEVSAWWVWRKQWGKMVSYARLRYLPGGSQRLYLYYDDGLRTPLDEMPPDTWYMPATVPQPPSSGEVGP